MLTPKSWMVLWILGTVGGCIVGLVASFCLALALNPISSDIESIFVLSVVGFCIGLFQWGIALKGIVNGAAWVTATTIATFLILWALNFASNNHLIPYILEYYNPGCLSASCDSYQLYDTWATGAVIIMIIIALSSALPTGIVLSRYSSRSYLWIVGCVVASAAGVLGYIAISITISGLFEELCSAGLILPVVTASISAFFIHHTLAIRKA